MSLAVWDERLGQRVGAALLVAIGLAGGAVVVTDGCRLRPSYRATVFFEHTPLVEDSEVQVAGRVVGWVEGIRLISPRTATGDHPLAPTGGVAVDLRIERRYRAMLAANGDYFINAKGLLGKPYLEAGPPPDDAAWAGLLAPDSHLRGIDPPTVDRVLNRSYENLVNAAVFLTVVRPPARALRDEVLQLADTLESLEPGSGVFAETAASFRAPVAEASALRGVLDAADVDSARLRDLVGRARQLASRGNQALAELRARVAELQQNLTTIESKLPAAALTRARQSLAGLDEQLTRLQRIAATAKELAAMVEAGEGTVGALLHDPEFSDDTKALGKYIKRHPWTLLGLRRND